MTYRDVVEMQFKSHLRTALGFLHLSAQLIEEIVESPDEDRERWLNQLEKDDLTEFVDWCIDVVNPINPDQQREAWANGLEFLRRVREKRARGLKRAELAGE